MMAPRDNVTHICEYGNPLFANNPYVYDIQDIQRFLKYNSIALEAVNPYLIVGP